MASSSQEPSVDGAGNISLMNEFLAVTILPDAGGNISELVDRRTGRNWLWRNPHLPIESRRTGDDYGRDLDSGGWDEVLFSVSPDQVRVPGQSARRIPDHGDLVRRAWNRLAVNDGQQRCDLTVTSDVFACEFSRKVRLAADEPRIEFDYSLTNNESFAWPWYWCAHALIAVQPGMAINLPAAQPYRVESSSSKLNPEERTRHWPALDVRGSAIADLSDSFPAEDNGNAFAGKLFVQSPDDGVISVITPDHREMLTMMYDPGQLPWLGLWINNRGWSGCGSEPYLNLGIEPGTAPYDSVSEAIENGAITSMQAGETRRWQLVVEIHS